MGNVCVAQPPGLDIGELPLSMEAYFEHKNKSVPQATTVRVLSYNIFVRPLWINSNGNDYKEERLEEFSKAIHSFDVICLQEMFSVYTDRQDILLKKAKEAGFLYTASAPKPKSLSTFIVDGGLVVLSRYPIESIKWVNYPGGTGACYFTQKGALYTKIRVGSSTLNVFSTHAQATYDAGEAHLITRTEQFNILHEFINTCLEKHEYKDGDMTLVVGDFNVDGRHLVRYEGKNFVNHPAFQRIPNLTKRETFTEYDALVACMNDDGKDLVVDVIYDNLKEHPITYGDFTVDASGNKVPKETVLTDKSTWGVGESLDYIFAYTPARQLQNKHNYAKGLKVNTSQGLSVLKETAQVVPFLIEGHPFAQLSDHYAVSVTLQYTNVQHNGTDTPETTTSSPKKPEAH